MTKRAVYFEAKRKLRIVGLMSGTSADGIDVAVVDFDGRRVKLVAFDMVPYPANLRRDIFKLFDPKTSRVDDICRMNMLLGEKFADAVVQTCQKTKVDLRSIDLIGSHGQTIYHIPQPPRSTLQIAEPSVIAERTGITTVADFRPRDIAAGGQGAPLVPYADYILFRHDTRTRALQNIGGIANVTFLPAGGGVDDILAFDTGPGNMIIDRLTAIITNGRQTYDKGGNLAAGGKVVPTLLQEWMRHPYFRQTPPKTTGRETFGLQFTEKLYTAARTRKIAPLDLLTTATAFTARSIADAYRRFLPRAVDEVILCGGGSWNDTLVAMLKDEMPETNILLMTDFGIDPDAKEAVSFAILAYATVHAQTNNVPAATGAKRSVVLGKVIPGGLHVAVSSRRMKHR